MQSCIHGRVNGSYFLCSGSKGTCKHEDPNHQQDVLVAGSLGKYAHLLFKTLSRGDDHCIHGSYQKGSRYRHSIEVSDDQRGHQIYTQKYKQRAESQPAAYMFFIMSVWKESHLYSANACL